MTWLQLRILVLISCATIINFFDRSAISFAILPIEHDLNLTNTDFGWIAGAFGIGYMAMAVIGGILVDRFGAVLIWMVSAIVWSGVTIGLGLARSFEELFILRILLGFAESIHFSCLLKTIVDWLPLHLRARSIAIGLFGVPISAIIGAPFISWLIEFFGWHKMFYILGVLGIIWAVLWTMNFKGREWIKPKKITPLSQTTQIFERGTSWRTILSSHSFQMSCFIFFVFGYILFFALMWMPGYFEQTYGTNILLTGYLVVIPWALSALAILFGGSLSDRLLKRTQNLRKSRSLIIGLGMGLSGVFFVATILIHSLPLSLLFLSLSLALAFAINAPIYALNADLFPRHSGTAQGIMNLFLALASFLAPILTGWLTSISGDFTIALSLIAALSFVAAALALFIQNPQAPEAQTH